jgi:hypothetical protein
MSIDYHTHRIRLNKNRPLLSASHPTTCIRWIEQWLNRNALAEDIFAPLVWAALVGACPIDAPAEIRKSVLYC